MVGSLNPSPYIDLPFRGTDGRVVVVACLLHVCIHARFHGRIAILLVIVANSGTVAIPTSLNFPLFLFLHRPTALRVVSR